MINSSNKSRIVAESSQVQNKADKKVGVNDVSAVCETDSLGTFGNHIRRVLKTKAPIRVQILVDFFGGEGSWNDQMTFY